tara:strand:+ start:2077 stop:2835 length:759 start_codon:yes stop_codon:yes gene_type:complete
MKNKIFYILPSYNESENIKPLLDKFNKFYKNKNNFIQIVFVDDGSTDNSLNILSKLRKKINSKIKIKILKHKKNLGLGMALKTGFRYSLNEAKKNDVIITMDTDNSHTIELSYSLAKKIIYGKKDIVIASRYIKNSKIKGLQMSRKFLSSAAAILFKIFYPIKNVKDYTSGFRAFRVIKIKKIIKNNSNFFSETGFSASVDILLKLYPFRNQLNFYELPINLRYDLKKGKSKMKIIKTVYLNLRILLLRKII